MPRAFFFSLSFASLSILPPNLKIAPSGLDVRLLRRRGRREPHRSRVRRLELAPSRVVGGVVGQGPHESARGRRGVSFAFLFRRRRRRRRGLDASRQGPVQSSDGGGLGGCRVCRVRGGGPDLVRLRELGSDLRVGVQLSVGRFCKTAEDGGGDDEQCRRERDQNRELGCVPTHVLIPIPVPLASLTIERCSTRDRSRGMDTTKALPETKLPMTTTTTRTIRRLLG